MPRYFFRVHNGEDLFDAEGTVLDGPQQAKTESIITAGDMLKDVGGHWNGEEWTMHVVDEAGSTVCRLRFLAESVDHNVLNA